MSKKLYQSEDYAPLPPINAAIITTGCDYCAVGCGYKVYRWPTQFPDGGPKADENALGITFPSHSLQEWVAPTQHSVVSYQGKEHKIVILPDKQTNVVNKTGDSSIRGGLIAEKCYNPEKRTKDRLQTPLVRINGTLTPVSWDFALDVAAQVGKHVLYKHGKNAYAIKSYSYQYIENTYAITKFAFRKIQTPNFSFHNTPVLVSSTPGMDDAGFDNFAPSYDDWASADTLMICGCDPYETKTIIFTQFIMPGIAKGMKVIAINPRETAGIAYIKKRGGLHLDILPGTDNLVLGAIARIILKNGWEDADWIKNWVNDHTSEDSNTQGQFTAKNFAEYKKWNLQQAEFEASSAAIKAGIDVQKLITAAEWLAKPVDGKRPKTSIGFERGLSWSNNTANTSAIASLATICGAGGRPGQVVGRFGGHQLGQMMGGNYPLLDSPIKDANGKPQVLDVDKWLLEGNTRFAYVIGTTWVQSTAGSNALAEKLEALVSKNAHQVHSDNKEEVIATLIKRVDSGGMVVVNQDIYLRDPVGAKFADIIFPAATWGEEDFVRANGERRLRLYQAFYDAPGEAKPDWKIIAELAEKMSFDGFEWKNSNDVAEEAAAHSTKSNTSFNMLKVAAHVEGKTLHQKLKELGTNGIQAPVMYNYKTAMLHGTKRLHDTTVASERLAEIGMENESSTNENYYGQHMSQFNTATGKVNMQTHPWVLFSDVWEWLSPKKDELWLSNGRINEVWQSGFDDVERRDYIAQRWPGNWVEINPVDAKKRGIESGDTVSISSDRVASLDNKMAKKQVKGLQFSDLLKKGHIKLSSASISATAIVTPATKQGVIYANFHDMKQAVNALTSSIPDNISGNYNYKMGVAKIKKVGKSEFKDDLRTMSFAPRNIS